MKVFVYGTLMTGCGNHRLLRGSRFVSEASTRPVFRLLHLGGFPAAVDGGETAIRGEVFEVDETTLRALDQLEGHPTFYRRRVVALADGQRASIYVFQSEKRARFAREIPSGDWREADRRNEMNGGW